MKKIIINKLQGLMLIILFISILPLTSPFFIFGFLKQILSDAYDLGIECCDKFINYIDEL
jgi:hypothetical protein